MNTDFQYDVIFAGGGTSGCLAAGRLAAADANLKILVLEAGDHTHNIPAHIQPARYLSHLAPSSKTVTFNVSKSSKELADRSLVIPSAHCVGGGSSVNFMMYTRGAASDYDDWENIYGNTGWGMKDLLPLFKKTETYQVRPELPTHGYNGPLKVSYGGTYTNVGKEFLAAAAEYDKRGTTDDINSFYSCNAYGRWEKWMDAETGHRSDVPHHFIYNQEQNKNLHVLAGKRVKRILFENNRAVGVEYVNDIMIRPDADQTVHVARASRLIVVSAGAFGSPLILERSGIGGRQLLDRVGVPVVSDLPGVGEHYQDHNLVFVPYLADESVETLDAFFRGDPDEERKLVDQWTQTGQGLLAHNGIDAGIKLRPDDDDLKELGPAFQKRWTEYFVSSPDKPVIFIGPAAAYLGDPSLAPARKYFSLGYFTEYPVSTGSVHIASAKDPHAAPEFICGFLKDPADVATLKWGYKKSRELARRMAMYRGEYLPGHPKFPTESSALCSDSVTGPIDRKASDIIYTVQDDEAIEQFNREFVQTTWHSLGTCAMKARDKGGVVDANLNVYGVSGLKMSICPGNIGGNTYSTATVIGEKAAVIIAEELGIKNV